MELAILFGDRQIVDAGEALLHAALLIELPVLVAVGAKPLVPGVMPFIGKTHGDPIAGERPDFLDQAVVELALPFGGQERDDLITAAGEFGSVAPLTVGCVGEGHAMGIARVPAVLGQANLLDCRVESEGGKGGLGSIC